MLKNSSIKLNTTISPSNAYNKNVKWSSSNTNIATVDSNGNVTGKNAGTVTITALAKDGTAIKGTYSVKVILTELSFKDVTVDNWYYNAVKYTYENEMISGYNTTTFAPNDKLTRGMLVTILWRMEGSPNNNGKSKFSDVETNSWYAKAIKWAADNGVVNGYKNGKFGPKDNITRQDLAGILRNYAIYKKKNVNKTADLTKYNDYKTISSYATTSMSWAVSTGVISGNKNGTLTPKGNATRAEAAGMIYNYCINIGK